MNARLSGRDHLRVVGGCGGGHQTTFTAKFKLEGTARQPFREGDSQRSGPLAGWYGNVTGHARAGETEQGAD